MFRLLLFSSRDVLDTGKSLELASIFPMCNDGLDKPSYSWSDHQWVLTDLPLPVSDPFHKHFPLTGGDSLGVNWCQRCNYLSTQNLHILDYFRIFRLLLRKKNKMQPFYLRRLSRVRAHFGQSNLSFFQQKRKKEILLSLVIFIYFKVQKKGKRSGKLIFFHFSNWSEKNEIIFDS